MGWLTPSKALRPSWVTIGQWVTITQEFSHFRFQNRAVNLIAQRGMRHQECHGMHLSRVRVGRGRVGRVDPPQTMLEVEAAGLRIFCLDEEPGRHPVEVMGRQELLQHGAPKPFTLSFSADCDVRHYTQVKGRPMLDRHTGIATLCYL